MNKQVIIIGGGGHAKVLLEILIIKKIKVYGFTDLDENRKLSLGKVRLKYLGKDEVIKKFSPKKFDLVNGLGSVGIDTLRKRSQKFMEFKNLQFRFLNVIHPRAIISKDVKDAIALNEGVQIMAGANIRPGSEIGDNTIVNTGASIDHDCHIGTHVHIAPGVVLSGGVEMGDSCHIGTGSLIRNGIKIGREVFVPMGCSVTKNMEAGEVSVRFLNASGQQKANGQ
ncbi:MAG: hypothetical protein AUJ71_02885 [Candidatus Omnitrophica bacterium CG1_02_49_16]|nr:MAG: hypothetical protein AUJ71_02885 [Candidatus Omnitrophica bacterium CG1_02_49_16]